VEKWTRINPANSDKIAPHFPCGVSVEVHAAVMRAIGQADLPLLKIGLLIKDDQALSRLVLEHVNSASNALRQPVESVRQGVALLGINRLRDYLSTIEHMGVDDRQPIKPTTP